MTDRHGNPQPGDGFFHYIQAGKAIETWAQSIDNGWENYVWKEKKPKTDGSFTQTGWRSAATNIVTEFNSLIAPLSVSMSADDKNGSHDKKLKVLQAYLEQKARAAAAGSKAQALVA